MKNRTISMLIILMSSHAFAICGDQPYIETNANKCEKALGSFWYTKTARKIFSNCSNKESCKVEGENYETISTDIVSFSKNCICLYDAENKEFISTLPEKAKLLLVSENIQNSSVAFQNQNAQILLAERCKNEGYSKCYNGVPWGTVLDIQRDGNKSSFSAETLKKICPIPQKIPGIVDDENLSECGSRIVPEDSKIELILANTSECNVIVVGSHLVGFALRLPDTDEKELLLVKAELRKKYGDPQPIATCAAGGYGSKYYKFTTQTGLEVVLSSTNVSRGKSPTFVRYLQMPEAAKAITEATSILKGKIKEKRKSETNEIQKALGDL